MNIRRSILMATAVTLLLAAPAFAQFTMPGISHLPNQDAWNKFALSHPNTARELRNNPTLIFDPQWISNHPQLDQFLRNHPQDYAAIRARGSEYYSPGFNSWLSGHPNAAAQLKENPGLVYDKNWAAKHPQFQQYYSKNPNVWKYGAPGESRRGWGEYDDSHVWRNADWWRANHPNWTRKHHPDWAEQAAQQDQQQQRHRKMHGQHGDHHDND